MIRFDLIFSDNKVAEIGHFCFGVLKDRLNRGNEPRGQVINRFNRREVHLAAVVYYPSESTGGPYVEPGVDQQELYNLVEEVVNAVPFVREITTIGMHPVHNKVYVKVRAGDVDVDHTMMALFLVRNLTYIRDIHDLYKAARAKGYTPLVSIVASGLVSSNKGFNAREILYLRDPGEYNLFNIRTFGRQALTRFLQGGQGDWYQSDWVEDHVYHRDIWFDNHGIGFRGMRGKYSPRILIDCMSVPEDEPFIDVDEFNQRVRHLDYLDVFIRDTLGPFFLEEGLPLTV